MPTQRSRMQRFSQTLVVVLLASTTLGGECQEYLEHSAEQERKALEAADTQRLLSYTRQRERRSAQRKVLIERLQAQLERLQRASADFPVAFEKARLRLHVRPGSEPCGVDGPKDSDESQPRMGPIAGGSLRPPVPEQIAVAEQRTTSALASLVHELPRAENIAAQLRVMQELIEAEDQARSVLEKSPTWAWTTVIEHHSAPQLSSSPDGLSYKSGHSDGIAYLYRLADAQFVCLAPFSVNNRDDVDLSELHYVSDGYSYNPNTRRQEPRTRTVKRSLSEAAALHKLRRDLDARIAQAIGQNAVRAELAAETKGPMKKAKTRQR